MSARSADSYDADPFKGTSGGFTADGDVELITRPEGFSGAISLPLLPDLIQIYTVSMANGALTIRRGRDQGTIWFERGEMVHAVCGEETGEEAVYRLLQWHNGNFSLDPDARASIRSITSSWQNVLMEGLRLLDESVPLPEPIDAALAELEEILGGPGALAVFDEHGALLVQRTHVAGLDLTAAGPALREMLRRQASVMQALAQPAALLDCFWILGDQLHLIAPLPDQRLLHLVVDGTSANLAVIRRAAARVAEKLA